MSERTGKSATFIAGIIVGAIVLGGGGVAWAATGSPLILGHSNKATKTTKIVDRKGTPLSLTAKAGKAPLAVNSKTRVTNLNADTVDGLSSGSFARTTGQFGIITAEGVFLDLTDDGVDNPDVLAALAFCPPGTQVTGGGTDNITNSPLVIDSPDIGLWISAAFDVDPAAHTADELLAYAICYNPKGAVPGALTFTAKKQIPASVMQRLARAEH
jgi:hypothetical protein